jgi:hypothetical protein
MKKSIGKVLIASLLVMLTFIAVEAANQSIVIDASYENRAYQTAQTSASAGDVETVIFERKPGLEGLSYTLEHNDSIEVTRVIVSRQGASGSYYSVAGDTIISTYSAVAAGAKAATVTLAPLAGRYKVTVQCDTVGMVVPPTINHTFNTQYAY